MSDRKRIVFWRSVGLMGVLAALSCYAYFNVRVDRIRAEHEGQKVQLLRYTRDMAVDHVIAADDLEIVPVHKEWAEPLGRVLKQENRAFSIGRRVNCETVEGQWVQWVHLTERIPTSAPPHVPPDCALISVSTDPETSLLVGGLRGGERANLMAIVRDQDGQENIFAVIEDVRVVACIVKNPVLTAADCRIVVQARQETALPLLEILSHIGGNVTALPRKPEGLPETPAERIDPDLLSLLRQRNAPKGVNPHEPRSHSP